MTYSAKALQTQTHLQQAFIRCVLRQSFNTLTINDLVHQAKLSRGTFYHYFEDKYDQLEHYETALLTTIDDIFNRYPKDIPQAATTQHFQTNAFYQMFAYLAANQSLVQAILACDGDNFRVKMAHTIAAQTAQHPAHLPELPDNLQIPANYAQNLVVENILSLIIFWLTQDDPEPPKTAFAIFVKSRFLAPVDLLKLS